MAVTRGTWALAVLEALSLPTCQENEDLFSAWALAESGQERNDGQVVLLGTQSILRNRRREQLTSTVSV